MKTWIGLILVCILLLASANGLAAADRNPVAGSLVGPYGIDWLPKVGYGALRLTVSGPQGVFLTKSFPGGKTPRFELSEIKEGCPDGIYTYELRVQAAARPENRDGTPDASIADTQRPLIQSGHFRIRGGAIVVASGVEAGTAPRDGILATYNEDLYVKGSLCVGTDCADPETWNYDVIRMKENNLRIHFDDTSSTSSFPANDWRIVLNDSSDGGGNYFAVEDSTSGDVPFTIEAGAPANSLFVEDYGRIGLKTSTPAVELHMVDGDSPAVRLDQDTTSGWTAQAWDLVGNESNFFVRDVTNSARIPFRIQPGTPSSTLSLKSSGYVGIGTWSPEYNLEVEGTSANVTLGVQRTDGATMKLSAMGSSGQIGTVTEHALNFMTNNVKRLSVGASTGNVGIGVTSPTYPLHMASGAYCSAGGAWTNASSIAFKQNVQALGLADARRALADLRPVSFAYKADPGEEHLGFIAEEVPELVATGDRQGLSPMDIVAVLTRVVQEQQKTIADQRRELAELGRRVAELESRETR